jgi:Domain of unknown function (DUF4430)
MKKVILVLSGTAALACGVVVPAALGAASHAAAGATVTVQIKTLTKTLLAPTAEHGEKGWITKGGTPRGKCSGNSAAGALDAATHGKWAGKYYPSLHDIFVTSIDGVKPSRSDNWEFDVNGKASNVGVCEVKLHAGERLLFKIVK